MANIGLLITKLNGGGAERTVANLSKIFSNHNHNVYIILFDGNNISYPYVGNIIDLKLGINYGIIDMLKKNYLRVQKIKKIKKKYKLDVMVSFLDTPNLVNVLTKVKNCKNIVSIRNNLSSEHQGKLRKHIIRYTSNHAYLTVAISESVKHDLIENYNISENKIVTIYNPINIEDLLISENDYVDFPNDFDEYYNIVTMGRLTYQKGQRYLINVMKEVVKKNNKVRLYILGEGELENELKELVRRNKLENNIKFLGFINNPHKFMKKCNLFIFPSIYEGLGNVLLEAMALGLPVISTDCKSGPREIIAPQSNLYNICDDIEYADFGILIPPFNETLDNSIVEKKLYEAILTIIKDNSKAMYYSEQSIKRIAYFNDNVIFSKWMDVF